MRDEFQLGTLDAAKKRIRRARERGYLPPPEPDGPGVFSMASMQRTRALLEVAGFTAVHMADVPVRFSFRDLDNYEAWIREVTPFGAALVDVSEREHRAFRSTLEAAIEPFLTDRGYELPGVALTAVAS